MVEQMEQRRLLAASIVSGVLTVDGTSSGETINLSWNASGTPSVKVTINGVQQGASPFAVSSFNSVIIYAKNGDDTIDCHAIATGFTSYSSLKPVTANGEAGADLIYGSDSADTLIGGSSSDSLMGNGGNDVIYGQSEADLLDGGSGSDILLGGTGADLMFGGRSDNNAFTYGADGATDTFYGNDTSLVNDGSVDRVAVGTFGGGTVFQEIDDGTSYTDNV